MDPLPDVVCRLEPRNGEFCYQLVIFSPDRTRFTQDLISGLAMRDDPVAMVRHILNKRGVDAATALRACWIRHNPIPDGFTPQTQKLNWQQTRTLEMIMEWYMPTTRGPIVVVPGS